MDSDISRVILFYDLQITGTCIPSYLSGSQLANVFTSAFPDDHIRINDDITVDKLCSTEEYFWGSIGKQSSLSRDPLARKRNVDLSTEPLPQDYRIEFFSYFMVHFATSCMVILHNPFAPRAPKYIEKHLYAMNQTSIIKSTIKPRLSKDIPTMLGRFQDLCNLKLGFSPGPLDRFNLPSISEMKKIVKEGEVHVNIEIAFQSIAPTEEIIEALIASKSEGLRGLKVSGAIGENSLMHTVDLFSQLMTHKVVINVEDDRLKTEDVIKSLLLDEIRSQISSD